MTVTTRHHHRIRRPGPPASRSRRYTPPNGFGLDTHRNHDRADHLARVFYAHRNAELRALERHQAEELARRAAAHAAEAAELGKAAPSAGGPIGATITSTYDPHRAHREAVEAWIHDRGPGPEGGAGMVAR